MCIYTVKSKKFENRLKIPQEGCATPPNVPKLASLWLKNTAKPNKD